MEKGHSLDFYRPGLQGGGGVVGLVVHDIKGTTSPGKDLECLILNKPREIIV